MRIGLGDGLCCLGGVVGAASSTSAIVVIPVVIIVVVACVVTVTSVVGIQDGLNRTSSRSTINVHSVKLEDVPYDVDDGVARGRLTYTHDVLADTQFWFC